MLDFLRQNWLVFVAGLTTSGFSAAAMMFWRRVKREINEQATLKAGVLALLHDRLYQACMHYLRIGEISTECLKNLENLYKGYRELGGNGTCEEIYKRTRALAIKPFIE